MAAATTDASLPDSTRNQDQINLAHLGMGLIVLTTFIYCAATALQYLLLS